MQPPTSDNKHLVLIGGGHSHAIALKLMGMRPLPGVRLTLISDVTDTPYSGMLPGYVAGLYGFDDCHIDLYPLAAFAAATLVRDRAIGLDLQQNQVICAQHPPIRFDALSIDIGSTPATVTVPGAREYTIPVKPISRFLSYWQTLVEQVSALPQQPIRLAVVGGGAGGTELALSVQARLSRIFRDAGQLPENLELHLFQRGDRLVPERTPWVGRTLQRILRQRGVHLHLGERVSAVEADSPDGGRRVRCESGLVVECDRVFWVTQAAAAPWLRASGLATDERGFMQVSNTLQSVSHPQVFGAGDVATMVHQPRPKAGVFAVRQGQPLFENLRRFLQGIPPKPFRPQQEFLILIGTGDESAIASRGIFRLGPHPLIWRWKDRIDRQFMERFTDLPPMTSSPVAKPTPATPATLPCAGCGSKVGGSTLENALNRLKTEGLLKETEHLLLGLDSPDDAAVIQLPPNLALVQTVDYFRALVSDPFLLGQITAHHCLNDLFAMGVDPHSALAIATLPYANPAISEEILYHLLAGATRVLHQSGAALIGGHTVEGTELAFGLTCNGLADPVHLLRKGGMRPGDVLILTKPLGTGTLFAAHMQLRAKGRWLDRAIASMLHSNQTAARLFRQFQTTACTDITGFGLAGHLLEMVKASPDVAVHLDLDAIPLLDGAEVTLAQGFFSSLHPQNWEATRQIADLHKVAQHPHLPALVDPQTAGGLLAAVPEKRATACLTALQTQGYTRSAIIGRVLNQAPDPALRDEQIQYTFRTVPRLFLKSSSPSPIADSPSPTAHHADSSRF
jgi:selenide,water dikinase